MDQAADGKDETRDLLMGSSRTSMNLALLKQRTEDAIKSLDGILRTLQFQSVQWGPMLDQFAVFNVKLARIKEQLRPLLEHYVVHPIALTQENAEIMHLLLATKLLPEMEEEESRFLIEHGLHVAQDQPMEDLFVNMSEQLDSHNGIINHLTVKSEMPESGLLDQRGPSRHKCNEMSRKIVRMVSKLHEKHRAPTKVKAAEQPVKSAKGSKSKPDSRELLLKAMLTGEGFRS